MEDFHYLQHHPFLLDSAFYPNESPTLLSQQAEAPSCFPYYYSSDAKTHESSCSLDSATRAPVGESHMSFASLVSEAPTPQVSLESKRKSSNGTSTQSKVTKECKSKKHKIPSDALKGTEEKKVRAGVKAIKTCDEPPAGYIHVRARRGQATDSHSLAERVRREKISERMKMLQGLVPGCENVTGKALVLDEIINYVQSLQNQVEFLSMKLASFNPILYDLGDHYDECMSQSEKMGSMPLPQPMPSAIQSCHTQHTAFENATSNYPIMDSSAPFLLHGQGSTTFSQANDCFQVQVGDQREGYLNQAEFNNMFSTH